MTLELPIFLVNSGRRLLIGGCAAFSMVGAAFAAPLTYVDLTASASGEQPFTVGLAIKKGDVPSGTPSLGGSLVGSQVVVKRRWNDGSVKHAVASGRAVMTAGVPFRVTVLSDPPGSAGTSLAPADIQTASPSASVKLGSLGTVQLSDLLASPFRTWLSGPEMVECHYRGDVGNDSSMSVWFQVRLYKGGRVWVRAIVENGSVNATSTDKSYAPVVTIGGTVVYDHGGTALTHYRNTRWMAEGWIGGDPGITVKHESAYLIDTKLVPNYWKRNPDTSAFSGLNQTYVPMARGNLEEDMGVSGYQPSLGLLPLWDALYVTSGDARAWRTVLASSSSLNGYSIVWRDARSHLVAKPSEFPDFEIDGGTYKIQRGGNTWEMNHSPSEGYLAYLVTGDYWHYETALMHASLDYLALNGDFGLGLKRILRGETRGTAWNLRNLTQVTAISPEGDAVAEEYRTLLANNMAHWKTVKDGLTLPALGYLYEYDVNMDGQGVIRPWQQHFFIQSVGMGSDLEPLADMSTYNEVRDRLYLGAVGILGDDNGFCYNQANIYNLKIHDGTGTTDPKTWFKTWREVYVKTVDGAPACSNTLQGTSGSAPTLPNGYWGNLLPAIAYAVDHGAPGAAAAWARLSGTTNWATLENSGFNNLPIWGVVPRKTDGSKIRPVIKRGNSKTGAKGGYDLKGKWMSSAAGKPWLRLFFWSSESGGK